MLRVLFLGDVIGAPGREAVVRVLGDWRRERSIDFVVANGENLASGRGLTPASVAPLWEAGVHAVTSGNHVWDRKEIQDLIHDPRVLRPANYPVGTPGRGWGIYETNGVKIGVLNLMCRVYMPQTDCPFQTAARIVPEMRRQTPFIIVDMHAEISSEKQAMGHFLDGQVSAVIGTHTHTPTADERILSQGTAFLTDSGMVGPEDSVIGCKKEGFIQRFLTGVSTPLEIASGDVMVNATLIELEDTGLARSIQRIRQLVPRAALSPV